MAINPLINGVVKSVSQPEVNIDGTWRNVNMVSHNINGVWRESFNSSVYYVNLYRFGELWQSIPVVKGEYCYLKNYVCECICDSHTFYGWSTEWNSTSKKYGSTSQFKPTTDINLYAIFSNKSSTTVNAILTQTVQGGTNTFTMAKSGYIKLYGWTVNATQDTNGTVNSSGTGFLVHVSYGTVNISTSSNYVKINGVAVNANLNHMSNSDSINIAVEEGDIVQVSSATGSHIQITYPGLQTITDTIYIVVSHDEPSQIVLWNHEHIESTISVVEGLSVTPGYTTHMTDPDTYKFKGWSLAPDSTDIEYTSTSNIRPHGVLNLYAVYYYTDYDDIEMLTITSVYSTDVHTVTTASGTASVAASGPYGTTATLKTNGQAPYVKHNGAYVSGTTPFTFNVNEGDTITPIGNVLSDQSGATGNTITVVYPHHPIKYAM